MLKLKTVVALAAISGSLAARDYWVYVGTYTGPKSKGIYVYRLDASTGKLIGGALAAELTNASFVAVHPRGNFLYAVNESKEGEVASFAINLKTGQLTPLNQVSSKGDGPCHLTLDKTGRALMIANYHSGSVAAYPVSRDGRLGQATAFIQHTGSRVDATRRQAPHAHSVNVSRDGRFVAAADLGLDQVLVYRLDPARALLSPNEPRFTAVKPGAGPRHFNFHPGGRFAYVINEIQSTVTAFAWDSRGGRLSEIQTISTLPSGFTASNSTAELLVHPSGRFLYGSNRGHDSIAVFSIDKTKGTLALIDHTPTQGNTPRNFGIDPSGRWLLAANQRSDTVVVFGIDAETGKLTPTGQVVEVGSPVCVRFAPAKPSKSAGK